MVLWQGRSICIVSDKEPLVVHFGASMRLAQKMAVTSRTRITRRVRNIPSLCRAVLSSWTNYLTGVQYTLDQIDVMNRLQKLYPHDFSQAVDSKTALAAFNQGKLISPLGVEGLHQIGNKVANLRLFYNLGVRYATLTHNCHNKFADAAVLSSPTRKAEPKWHGLSPIGRKLVHEMNRIGMIVDLAHVRYVVPTRYCHLAAPR